MRLGIKSLFFDVFRYPHLRIELGIGKNFVIQKPCLERVKAKDKKRLKKSI